MNVPTRITLCDDHPIVLAGLRNLLTAESDFVIVGEATNGMAALKLIQEVHPDVAILDDSMPELNGIAAARQLATDCPSVKILILTFHEDRAHLKQALGAGVAGYALKRSAAEHLVHAIRAVLAGGLYVDPAVASRMFETSTGQRTTLPEAMPQLTEREVEALKLTAQGFTNKEAGRQLGIGEKSVETYKARGMEKLALKTRAELVRYAAGQGWFD
ncbi:MAG TPA: response regulator transcription factor [Xanthobacteraceae bacterium]|jgi:DNA-binding NarL/FixJ family response regulator|nr:response regulator transcription factor [Xanthobacteraceae bacterium]